MCNASISLSSLVFSLPVGVSRFWAGMAHTSCVLVPVVVMSTVSCRFSGFGRDHDVSPHFLLYPFLSLFAKSFLLAVTPIFLLFLLFLLYFFSFFSLLPLLRVFCSHIFFSSVSPFLGYLDFIRFLVIGHVQSVRFANSNKHNQKHNQTRWVTDGEVCPKEQMPIRSQRSFCVHCPLCSAALLTCCETCHVV